VPNAVPEGDGMQGLQPLGLAGQVAHLTLVPPGQDANVPRGQDANVPRGQDANVPRGQDANVPRGQDASAKQPPTSVSLFDQGLIQVLEASATGLQPMKPYVLALSDSKNGEGTFESLASFMTNPAGAAIVNTMGPIRQLVQTDSEGRRRYLVIAPGTYDQHGAPVQVQAD